MRTEAHQRTVNDSEMMTAAVVDRNHPRRRRRWCNDHAEVADDRLEGDDAKMNRVDNRDHDRDHAQKNRRVHHGFDDRHTGEDDDSIVAVYEQMILPNETPVGVGVAVRYDLVRFYEVDPPRAKPAWRDHDPHPLFDADRHRCSHRRGARRQTVVADEPSCDHSRDRHRRDEESVARAHVRSHAHTRVRLKPVADEAAANPRYRRVANNSVCHRGAPRVVPPVTDDRVRRSDESRVHRVEARSVQASRHPTRTPIDERDYEHHCWY